jgi:hypothetical protein
VLGWLDDEAGSRGAEGAAREEAEGRAKRESEPHSFGKESGWRGRFA